MLEGIFVIYRNISQGLYTTSLKPFTEFQKQKETHFSQTIVVGAATTLCALLYKLQPPWRGEGGTWNVIVTTIFSTPPP